MVPARKSTVRKLAREIEELREQSDSRELAATIRILRDEIEYLRDRVKRLEIAAFDSVEPDGFETVYALTPYGRAMAGMENEPAAWVERIEA